MERMAEAVPANRGARVMEKVLRRLLEHPTGFTYGALAIAAAIALPQELASRRTGLEFLALLAIFAAWVQLWARRPVDSGRTAGTILLALLGTLLLASLAYRHLSFTLVATTLLPRYFINLPIPIAILSFVPMFIASEHSHTMAVVVDPSRLSWGMVFIRGAAVVLIGICFKVLAMQLEERARLQASLASAERKAGGLEERQRLAREIHDTLAQGFASIIVHFERAEQIDGLSASPAKPHLDLARSVAREGLDEARRMLAALRPEILVQRALPAALDRVCQDWSRRTGIAANLSITGAPAPMHPDIELTILRATQEALHNIGRHSGARTAAVTLSYMEDVLVLDVQDDGKGFVPSAAVGTGYGLTGIRERTESMQGSFSVESVPGEGTTVSLTLPVLRPAGSDTPTEGVTP
jgi:signal transduction histidine kinase